MRNTKKIALSGILSAMGAVIIFLGGLLGVLDISAACIASFIVLFCAAEMGQLYALLVYAAIAVLSFLICGNNIFAPICFAALFGPMAATKFLFPLVLLTVGWLFFSELLELPESKWLSALYFVLSMVIAVMTQWLYTLMARRYFFFWRDKIKKFLK